MESKNALYFCGGAVLGILGTVAFFYFWEENKPEPQLDDGLDQQTQSTQNTTVTKSSLDMNYTPPEKHNYTAYVNYLYSDSEDISEIDGHERIDDAKFQELSSEGNYDTILLTLYSDGILANEVTDEIMSESDAFTALGPNYTIRKLSRIFELSDTETVFIRNDRLYSLYEINQDDRTYGEVTGGGE